MNWKRMIIASVTGLDEGGTWTTASLRCPPFKPAIGVQHMPQPTRKETSGMWWYEGEQLVALLRWHTHLVFQHVPPPAWIDFLRDSKDSNIEEVAMWIDYESTVAAGYWSKYQAPLGTVQRTYTLHAPGEKLNRFGNPLVDPYEGYGNMGDPNDWAVRESKHSWFMDVGPENRYTEDFATVVAELIYKYPGTRVFTDNCYTWQYPGTATNVTMSEMLARGPAFVKELQVYLSTLRKLGLGVWGNCGAGGSDYPQLDLKMGELDLVDVADPAMFVHMIESGIARGEFDRRGLRQMYFAHCENRGQGVRWAQEVSRWDKTALLLDNVYHDNMGVVTARSSRYLMCPPLCA